MSGVTIEITVGGVRQAIESFAEYDRRAHGKVGDACQATARVVADRARMLAPVFNGDLAGSIRPGLGGGLVGNIATAEVIAHADYAAYVEYGTRPHTPPLQAISDWAYAHGMRPYALQRAIAERGTPAQPYMRPAAESERVGFEARLARALLEAEV